MPLFAHRLQIMKYFYVAWGWARRFPESFTYYACINDNRVDCKNFCM